MLLVDLFPAPPPSDSWIQAAPNRTLVLAYAQFDRAPPSGYLTVMLIEPLYDTESAGPPIWLPIEDEP
jgi:hypothetical protein